MKRSKFSEEQVAYALRQAESGTPVSDICRQLGVSEATFYVWRKKYAHLGVSDLRRLRRGPDARQAHPDGDHPKKPVTPTRRRERARWMAETFQIAVLRACRLAGVARSTWCKKSTARDQSALRLRIRELAHARPRFGYLRIHVLLRREGWRVNKKRVYRLYRLEGLQVRMRVRRRKHMALHRGPAPAPRGCTSAGAWTSSTTSSSPAGRFGC